MQESGPCVSTPRREGRAGHRGTSSPLPPRVCGASGRARLRQTRHRMPARRQVRGPIQPPRPGWRGMWRWPISRPRPIRSSGVHASPARGLWAVFFCARLGRPHRIHSRASWMWSARPRGCALRVEGTHLRRPVGDQYRPIVIPFTIAKARPPWRLASTTRARPICGSNQVAIFPLPERLKGRAWHAHVTSVGPHPVTPSAFVCPVNGRAAFVAIDLPAPAARGAFRHSISKSPEPRRRMKPPKVGDQHVAAPVSASSRRS